MIELRVYGLGAISIIPLTVYLILIVFFVVTSGLLLRRWGQRDGMRYSMRLLLVEWVFLMLCTAVIFRESSEYGGIIIIPLSSYFDIAENSYLMEKAALNILNVAMFVPVGMLLGLGFKGITWKKMLLASLSLSIMIELLQFILKRGGAKQMM